MCLEEMLGCPVERGALYYGEIRRREQVELTRELREKVTAMRRTNSVAPRTGSVD